MLPKLLRAEKDKVVERKNNMSKYNLTDILNEYIGGGRIGTLKISYKDLVDKMDELEKSGKVIVREKGSSADGKVNREFEVVDRDSAVPGGRKQERGFTVYDYKFGFDPGGEANFTEEYDFSVGGNDIRLAMDLIDGVKPYNFEENIKEEVELQEDPTRRSNNFFNDYKYGKGIYKLLGGKPFNASKVEKYLDAILDKFGDQQGIRIWERIGKNVGLDVSKYDDQPVEKFETALIGAIGDFYNTHIKESINEDEFDEARQKAIESSQEAAGIKEDAMKIYLQVVKIM